MNLPGLTPAQLERLAILSEELGEAQQAIGKILRHGYNSRNPHIDDAPRNVMSLMHELGDVEFAIQLLCDSGDLDGQTILACKDRKAEKIKRYLHHQPETK